MLKTLRECIDYGFYEVLMKKVVGITGIVSLEDISIVKNSITFYWAKLIGWKYHIHMSCNFKKKEQLDIIDWCKQNCLGDVHIPLAHISILSQALNPKKIITIYFDNKNDCLLFRLRFETIDDELLHSLRNH